MAIGYRRFKMLQGFLDLFLKLTWINTLTSLQHIGVKQGHLLTGSSRALP